MPVLTCHQQTLLRKTGGLTHSKHKAHRQVKQKAETYDAQLSPSTFF